MTETLVDRMQMQIVVDAIHEALSDRGRSVSDRDAEAATVALNGSSPVDAIDAAAECLDLEPAKVFDLAVALCQPVLGLRDWTVIYDA